MKQKLLLIVMILAIWLVVILTGKVMPRYSSMLLMLGFVLLYTWLHTLAMVHQKRMETKRPKPVNTNYLPKVTILLAAHNEETVIEDTLRNLLALDYPNFEVLVMDDRSTDDTPAILHRLSQEGDPTFRYCLRSESDDPGKASALNQGMLMTDGEVICVFDADASVGTDFLRKIMPFLADENVGGVQARKVISNWDDNTLTRCQEYEYCLDAHFQSGRDSVKGAVELRGNGQLVKREALAEVGGWNPHTLTDDLDLATRLHIAGWDIRFAHKVKVYEEGIPDFKDLLKQRRRWTEGTLFRYLEYAGPLIRSVRERRASLRTTLDMLAYFLEFLFPLWLVLDFIQLAWVWITSDPAPTLIITSFLVVPVFSVCTSIALVVAIIRFRKAPLREALPWGLITGIYMTILWFPLVFGIVVKVLFQSKRRTRWDKTIHKGSKRLHPVSEEPSVS